MITIIFIQMGDMKCKKCKGDLFRIEGLYTDRDGIRRDAYCPECHIRYGVRAHGLEIIRQHEYNLIKCPVCRGRKQIPARDDWLIPMDSGGNMGPQFIECPTCEGVGVIRDDILEG